MLRDKELRLMTDQTNSDALTIVFKDQTQLRGHAIYIVGYSTTSKKMLTVANGITTAAFTPANESGTLPALKLGSEITGISVDRSVEIDGARVYIFVAAKQHLEPPVITYSNGGASVKQPPVYQSQCFPVNAYVELTIGPSYGAVIDLSTVDGFVFPMNVTLNNNLAEIGNPINDPSCYMFNRASFFGAYIPFILTLPDDDARPYVSLKTGDSTDYYTELMNPGIYLNLTNRYGEFENLDSDLNMTFDAALEKLFNNSKLSIKGINTQTIESDVYNVVSTASQKLPQGPFSQPALQLKGQKYGNIFNVFSPLGVCVMNYEKDTYGEKTLVAIQGTIDSSTLTFDESLPLKDILLVDMFVEGNGTKGNTAVKSINYDDNNNITSVTLNQDLNKPCPGQYRFSKIPNMFCTSGAMVLGNMGLFAYAPDELHFTGDQKTILQNLQNQIVSALNRGVANKGPTSGGDQGYTTEYWGTETNWYPEGEPQNLFSLFMHTAKFPAADKEFPFFLQPPNAVSCARGTKMGQSYGFAYDENPGPVPPAPNNQPPVPSKFDPLPKDVTEVTVTIGFF